MALQLCSFWGADYAVMWCEKEAVPDFGVKIGQD
jgi:hypothetical protein